MRWTELAPKPPTLSAALTVAMLRKALERGLEPPARRHDLASALFWSGDYEAASREYESLRDLDPQGFRHWGVLGQLYLNLGQHEAALAACDQAYTAGEPPSWVRGKVLRKLGRDAEAVADLASYLRWEPNVFGLEELFSILARRREGGNLLAACDASPPALSMSTPVRAYRAIALSQLGRDDAAKALVDLHRHVLRERIEIPDVTEFNAVLAQEILAQRSPDAGVELDVNHKPNVTDSRAFRVLYRAIQDAMERYLSAFPAMGLDRVMSPLPEEGTLHAANVVLTGNGHNGEHIHSHGYISAVYHVAVPTIVAEAGDERGTLALGVCTAHTGGYQPCWGVRHIKPEAGWLTIFPSHVFHDVVPSMTEVPRISVAADLRLTESVHRPGLQRTV